MFYYGLLVKKEIRNFEILIPRFFYFQANSLVYFLLQAIFLYKLYTSMIQKYQLTLF